MGVSRRRVVGLGVMAPLVAACGGADKGSGAEPDAPDAPEPDLEALIREHLTDELGDAQVATTLTTKLLDAALTWAPPRIPLADVDSLVVYAFGNRLGPGGKPTPGPMNEHLAAVVAGLVEQKPMKVYAQWEVADALRDTHGLTDVVSIEPDGDNYLSTAGVAEKAVAAAGAEGLGQVGVIGYYDHAKRCVATSEAAGMTAAAVPTEADLPVDYDPDSGQDWTRTRQKYLLHDIAARLGTT